MKVLVTGATGFVGNYVIHELLRRGMDVVASSSSAEKAATKDWFTKVAFVEHSISPDSTEDLFKKFGEPEAMIHLAWGYLPDFKTQKHMDEVLPAHSAFLNNLVQHGIRNLTCVGTCLEYGMREGSQQEDMEPQPLFTYPLAKDLLRRELAELKAHYGFSFKWVRLYYMYGEGQSPKSILATLERAIQNKEEVFNMSLGEQERDYLPVEQVAENIVTYALQTEVEGIINCSSNRPVTIKQLVMDYLEKRKASIRLNLGYYPYTDYEPMRFWGDDAKQLKIKNKK